jgi:t-SNARE complex subunit (syntaxin)
MERSTLSTEQDALEAQAEQVAALAALIGREVATQAEVVQAIDDHATEASEHTEAAKLELMLAVGAGPWFGRCVCLMISGMAMLLLVLHLLTP